MKIIYKIPAVIIIAVLLLFSMCKEKSNVFTANSLSFDHSQVAVLGPNCIDDMPKQLRWMAIGIADVASDLAIRATIEDEMNSNDFFEVSHQRAHDELDNTNNFTFDIEVETSINTHFPSNSYNDDYFFTYNCDSCEWVTGLFSPNFDYTNISRSGRLYVVPAEEGIEADSIMGYYENSIGQIDSTWITQDSFETCYIWIVSSFNDCNGEPFSGESEGILKNKRGPCDFDSLCEYPMENISNCPDCGDNTTNYSLYVLEYEMLTDYKNGSALPKIEYQEGWRNKYEVGMQWIIYRDIDPTTATEYKAISSFRSSTNTHDFNATYTYEGMESVYTFDKVKAAGKNAQVKRCKLEDDGVTIDDCSRHKHKVFEDDILICQSYMPNDIFYFILYECDAPRHDNIWETPDDITISVGGSAFKREIWYSTKRKPYSYDPVSDSPAYKIDGNTNWQTESIGGVNYKVFETTLDGEIRIKFGYIPNF